MAKNNNADRISKIEQGMADMTESIAALAKVAEALVQAQGAPQAQADKDDDLFGAPETAEDVEDILARMTEDAGLLIGTDEGTVHMNGSSIGMALTVANALAQERHDSRTPIDPITAGYEDGYVPLTINVADGYLDPHDVLAVLRRSEVRGFRGDRLAIVQDETDVNEDGCAITALVGTDVWFNPRRVTTGYPSTDVERVRAGRDIIVRLARESGIHEGDITVTVGEVLVV